MTYRAVAKPRRGKPYDARVPSRELVMFRFLLFFDVSGVRPSASVRARPAVVARQNNRRRSPSKNDTKVKIAAARSTAFWKSHASACAPPDVGRDGRPNVWNEWNRKKGNAEQTREKHTSRVYVRRTRRKWRRRRRWPEPGASGENRDDGLGVLGVGDSVANSTCFTAISLACFKLQITRLAYCLKNVLFWKCVFKLFYEWIIHSK